MNIYIYIFFFTRYIEIISGGKEKYRGTIHPEMIHRERLMEWFAKGSRRRRKLNDFLTIRRGEERVFNQKEIFSRKKKVENIG